MSKRFRDKICVYCAERPSTTGDHIFARKFFPEEKRGDLPQVPACEPCNSDKARLEHYLTTLLPFGARHVDARDNLTEMVPPRLAKNVRLHRELAEGSSEIFTEERPGEFVPTMALPIDTDQLHRLVAYMVRGLSWHHWGALLQPEHGVKVISLSSFGVELMAGFFAVDARQRVHGNLGDDAFVYEGAQATDKAELSVWRMSMFGGLKLAGNPEDAGEETSIFFAMTGERDFIAHFAEAAGFKR